MRLPKNKIEELNTEFPQQDGNTVDLYILALNCQPKPKSIWPSVNQEAKITFNLLAMEKVPPRPLPILKQDTKFSMRKDCIKHWRVVDVKDLPLYVGAGIVTKLYEKYLKRAIKHE